MALNHLSKELNRTRYGYRMTTGHGETAKRQLISHLLYMDDLKLYGRNSDQLDGLLHTVRTFSDDIQMKFGLDKCAVAHFVNGRLSGHNSGVMVGKTDTIDRLERGQVYKYLCVDESNGIQHSMMRERLSREYFRRVKVVLWTELHGRNKILAINGFVLPVLTYGFGIIHCGAWTCSSSINRPESSSLCTVSTILLQTLTDCTLLAVMGVGSYNKLSRHINLVL